MTTTPQAALLREAAQSALITLDGISNANPRDKADFETPSEWIAWAKSRARFAADALREPISREVYAERILKQMLREASEPQAEKKCGTCGFIGQEDPVKGCPKCGFDDMRDKLQATQGALLSDEEIMRNWSGGACPDWAIKFVRACFAAQHAKLQSTQAEPCSVCNALIAPRNPTHYDQEDLDAAKVRATILHAGINVEADPVQAGELTPYVATASKGPVAFFVKWTEAGKPLRGEIRLYTEDQMRAALAARKPLTRRQINEASRDAQISFCLKSGGTYEEELARAIERAHGIGLEVKP